MFKTFNLPVGLILAVKVVQGELKAGSKIKIGNKIATVKSLESNREPVQTAEPGMDVGALVEGIEIADVDLTEYEFA